MFFPSRSLRLLENLDMQRVMWIAGRKRWKDQNLCGQEDDHIAQSHEYLSPRMSENEATEIAVRSTS